MDLSYTMQFVMMRAEAEADNGGRDDVAIEDVFLGILKLCEIRAKDFLKAPDDYLEKIDVEIRAMKQIFRDLFRERRLLIPASGYYEWEKAGKEKAKYAISAGNDFMYMAGLYRPRADGKGHEFVILTRDASPDLRFIHERMPVVFMPDAAQAWLSNDSDPETVLKRSEEKLRFSQMGAVQLCI